MTKKSMTTAAKAIGAMMTVGGAAAMIGTSMVGKTASKKQIKKTADKAVKTINGIIDGIQSVL